MNGSNRNRESTVSTSVVSSSTARGFRVSSRLNGNPTYRNHLFDNDYDDYLLRYKSHKDWRKLIGKNGEQSYNNHDMVDSNQKDAEMSDDEEEPVSLQFKMKIENNEEISKLENESSMAAALFSEIKAQQQQAKKQTRRLKIDPWKASRTPSANLEPKIRTRFDSPVNASPSRFCNANKSFTLISTHSGHTLSSTATNSGLYLDSSTHTLLATPANKACTLPAQQQLACTISTSFFDQHGINSNHRLASTPKPGN
jgi:hypothetical protein